MKIDNDITHPAVERSPSARWWLLQEPKVVSLTGISFIYYYFPLFSFICQRSFTKTFISNTREEMCCTSCVAISWCPSDRDNQWRHKQNGRHRKHTMHNTKDIRETHNIITTDKTTIPFLPLYSKPMQSGVKVKHSQAKRIHCPPKLAADSSSLNWFFKWGRVFFS